MRSRQTWAGILLFTPGHRWVKDIKIKIKTCLEREGLSPEGLARGKKVGESHYFLSPSPSWKIHREKLAGGTTIQDPGRQASFLTSGSFSELLASPQFPENYHLPFNLLHNLPSLSLIVCKPGHPCVQLFPAQEPLEVPGPGHMVRA